MTLVWMKFFNMNRKAMQQRQKQTNEVTKLKAFCTRQTINRVKRQPIKWEKIFANHASDNGLISKMY
jgi:hypothetical protein